MGPETSLQEAMYERNAGTTLCVGFPPWRRSYVSAFLYSPRGKVFFRSKINTKLLESYSVDRVVFWGSENSVKHRQHLRQTGVEIWCVEDGFLRSVGLGKYYIPPLSLVFDQSGIYYDPNGVSDLETLLSDTDFTELECERALELVSKIISSNISKYNVGSESIEKALIEQIASASKTILVPGQVQRDASIRLGCEAINSDEKLLAEVRNNNAAALIVYKPHPDTVSGNSGESLTAAACSLADAVVREASVTECIDLVDEVHTMTSLVGFEALLRRKRVVVYGRPFYSGWGLTEDRLPISRRERKLSLAELVAGVLIRYPRYIDYKTGLFRTPEQTLEQLLDDRERTQRANRRGRAGAAIATFRVHRLMLKSINLMRSYFYGIKMKRRSRVS